MVGRDERTAGHTGPAWPGQGGTAGASEAEAQPKPDAPKVRPGEPGSLD